MENFRCINCKNYLGDLTCQAFKEIPESILVGENEHLKPLPEQDNDIVFEAKGKKNGK
jgi:hypothetical protein